MIFYYNAKDKPAKKMRKEKKHHVYKKKTFNIFLSLVVLSALFIYLVQSNSLLTRGYELKQVEKKSQEVKRFRKELETKSLELQSMTIMTPKIEKLNMVEVGVAKFITPQEKSVAKK